MKKLWFLIGITVVMAAALAGCGKSGNSASGQTASVKDYVYSVENLEIKGDERFGSVNLLKGGDTVYAYHYSYSDDGSNTFIDLQIIDDKGSVKETNRITLEESASLSSLRADGKGNLYGVKNIYAQEPDEEGNYSESYSLVKYTDKGEEVFSKQLNGMPELKELEEGSDYFYTGDLFLQNDSLYLNLMGTYVKFDQDGNFQKIIKPEEESSLDGASLYALENGKVAALLYEETGSYVAYADLEKGTVSQKTKLPGASYEYSVYPGIGYDLYMVNSYGVFGYNVGDEDKTQLMSYVDSDLGVYSIYNLVALNDKQFLGVYDEVEASSPSVGKFTKVDPKDVKEKEVIVLACAGIDWNIRTNVVKFNKTNENYRISIQDYSSLYGSETDYMAGINRLNADIVSGKVPDLLLINSNMPAESYISKGLFEDIRPYIDKDEELDINNYMPNVIEAFSVNGKLYQLIPSFMINTVVAKASDVGKERGWTIQEAIDLLSSKPEGTQLLTYVTRDNMLYYSMTMAGNQFIDWETGKCSFDSEGFTQLLEFLKQFPEKIEDTAYSDDYWQNYDTMWREGKVICQMTSISDFRSYNYLEKGTFGEQITMIGFPSMNEDGSAIIPSTQLAMISKSSKKEGVWQFMRYFLTDEYQNNIENALPLSVKRLEEMATEAMKKPVYTDENGNEVEQEDTFYLGGVEIPISPMTKEEADRFKEQVYSVTQVYNYNENLMQIIEEETAPFFSGQKSAKDVASIIQNRAQIFVNENR